MIAASVRLYYCVRLNTFEHILVVSNKEYSCMGSHLNICQDRQSNKYLDVTVSQAIWAEVEPCCSIVAACLPSLGPLAKEGHFLHSMIMSLRSLASKSSKTSSITADEGSASSEDLPKRPWYKMQSDANGTSSSQDIELQPKEPKGILVQKSFTATAAS